MTEDIQSLLKYIRRTNPEMTKDKLVEELSKCHYSAVALIMTWQNGKKEESLPS